MRKTLIAVFIGSLWASAAFAQQPLDAVDYKAAYCTGRLRDVELPQISPSDPQVANDLGHQLVDQINNARTRLKSYLVPRLSYLDGAAVLATMQVGVEEQRQYVSVMKDCMAKASAGGTMPSAKMVNDCAAHSDWPKLKECEATAFLPF
jgi:hypothetical protein